MISGFKVFEWYAPSALLTQIVFNSCLGNFLTILQVNPLMAEVTDGKVKMICAKWQLFLCPDPNSLVYWGLPGNEAAELNLGGQ